MSDEATFAQFIRFFTTRLVQSLVQARLGQKIEQNCSAEPDQTDWFNTKIDELGEISAYLRSAVSKYPPLCSSLTIEFLLCTAESQYLPLETWEISIDTSEKDSDVNVCTELYHQLGRLLRSATSAARVTPMFRYYVKKQGEDTFVILYRVYEGAPQSELGTESKSIRIGQLPSPYGTVCLDLSYRTQMVLTHNPVIEQQIRAPPPVPHHVKQPLTCRPSFSDCIPVSGGNVELISPMSTTLCTFTASPAHSPSPGPGPTRFRLGKSTSSEDSSQSESQSYSLESKESNICSSFPRLRPNSFPFASLLTSSYAVKRTSVSSATDVVPEEPEQKTSEEKEEAVERPDDLEKTGKDLKDDEEDLASSDESFEQVCTFGSAERFGNDLGQFLKDCRGAPGTLQGTTDESMESLQNQLAHLSAQQHVFDDFVRTVRDQAEDDD